MNHLQKILIVFTCLAGAALAQQKLASKFDDPRIVHASERNVIPVYLCRNQGTEVTLPKHELLRIFTVGDPVNWQGIAVAEDRRDIGIRALEPMTNETIANVTSDHDSHYVLRLILGADHCDSHVTLEADQPLAEKIEATQPWVSPEQYKAALLATADARRQAEEANKRAQLAAEAAEQAKDQFRDKYPQRIVFDYSYDKKKAAAFGLTSVFHDERFTYIKAHSEEPPVLFELKDGQPSLIEFKYADGVYQTARIIDEGYLVRGGKPNGKHQEKLVIKREPKLDSQASSALDKGGV